MPNVTVGFGDGGRVAASTHLTSADDVVAAVAAAAAAAASGVLTSSAATPRQQLVATAMQSCLMWNAIYDPLETAPFVQARLRVAARR